MCVQLIAKLNIILNGECLLVYNQRSTLYRRLCSKFRMYSHRFPIKAVIMESTDDTNLVICVIVRISGFGNEFHQLL